MSDGNRYVTLIIYYTFWQETLCRQCMRILKLDYKSNRKLSIVADKSTWYQRRGRSARLLYRVSAAAMSAHQEARDVNAKIQHPFTHTLTHIIKIQSDQSYLTFFIIYNNTRYTKSQTRLFIYRCSRCKLNRDETHHVYCTYYYDYRNLGTFILLKQ